MKTISLQNSSKLLSKCLKVISVIIGICIIAMLLFCFKLLITYYNAPEKIIEIEAMILVDFPNFIMTKFMITMVFIVLRLFCVYFVIHYLSKMFQRIGEGESPFNQMNVIQIRKIIKWIFIYYVSLSIPLQIENVSVIVIGALIVLSLYCVSLIFEYGSSLQQDVDEML